eukprot:Clim_evm31s195 gene=Clim_evmTU31s195
MPEYVPLSERPEHSFNSLLATVLPSAEDQILINNAPSPRSSGSNISFRNGTMKTIDEEDEGDSSGSDSESQSNSSSGTNSKASSPRNTNGKGKKPVTIKRARSVDSSVDHFHFVPQHYYPGTTKDIPDALLDPISHEMLDTPVLVPCCGHTFSRSSIERWVRTRRSCPLCRSRLEMDECERDFVLEAVLKWRCEEWKSCDLERLKAANRRNMERRRKAMQSVRKTLQQKLDARFREQERERERQRMMYFNGSPHPHGNNVTYEIHSGHSAAMSDVLMAMVWALVSLPGWIYRNIGTVSEFVTKNRGRAVRMVALWSVQMAVMCMLWVAFLPIAVLFSMITAVTTSLRSIRTLAMWLIVLPLGTGALVVMTPLIMPLLALRIVMLGLNFGAGRTRRAPMPHRERSESTSSISEATPAQSSTSSTEATPRSVTAPCGSANTANGLSPADHLSLMLMLSGSGLPYHRRIR